MLRCRDRCHGVGSENEAFDERHISPQPRGIGPQPIKAASELGALLLAFLGEGEGGGMWGGKRGFVGSSAGPARRLLLRLYNPAVDPVCFTAVVVVAAVAVPILEVR